MRAKMQFNLEKDEFIRLVVIQRNKDGNKKTKILKIKDITKDHNYDEEVAKLIPFARENNARIYVNPTIKNRESIALSMLKKVADLISTKNLEGINRRLYDSVVDANKGVSGKKVWIIDIDEEVYDYLQLQEAKKFLGDNFIYIFRTKNGHHIWIKPHQFVLEEFKEASGLMHVELKKNSMTPIWWDMD